MWLDVKIIAQTVLELKNNDILRKKLAEASYKSASKHTRERQSREVITVFERIVK